MRLSIQYNTIQSHHGTGCICVHPTEIHPKHSQRSKEPAIIRVAGRMVSRWWTGERPQADTLESSLPEYRNVVVNLVYFKVGFTEVVPTVGGERDLEYLTATLSPPE